MSTRSTIAIALTALAAGAALGVLFAPASGADTRKKLARKGTDLRDRLAEMLEEGEDLIADLKEEAGTVASKARRASEQAKDRMKDKVDESAQAVRNAAHGV